MIGSEYAPDRYVGNDSTTEFGYGFKVNDATHLRVVIADADDDNEAVLVKDTDYTMTGVGEDAGGNVTLLDIRAHTGEAVVETLPQDWSITLKLDIDLTQLTNYHNQGGYFAETHEDSFDLLTQICQQLQEEIDRSLKVSETSGDSGSALDEDFGQILEDCQTARDAAETAQTGAETAQGLAETAQAGAETAETNAGTAQTAAETAQGLAETAQANAETAETGAEAAETGAVAARDSVVISTHAETAGVAQATIDISGSFSALDTDKANVKIFIDGAKLPTAEWTRTSSTVITLDAALSGGEKLEVESATSSVTGSATIQAHESNYAHVTSFGADFSTASGLALAATAVTADTYAMPANLIVDAKGRITGVREAVITDLPDDALEVQDDWVIPDTPFSTATINTTNIIETGLNYEQVWDLGPATLISADGSVDAADTGATGPAIYMTISGANVFGGSLTLTETEAGATITSGDATISTGQKVGIVPSFNGSSGDSDTPHVRAIWRLG